LQESVKSRRDEASITLDAKPVAVYNAEFIEPFDYENGGTTGAPKFPITLEILFNLMERKNIPESLLTLRRMGDGGIFDHLEGGFHRYSVDEHWIVPHFEKMLYDNALLLEALSKAFLVTKDLYFKEKATKVYEYLSRRLLSDNGFFAAQDADSEGEEGKYYVFTQAEIKKVVEHFELFKKYYSISEPGNFEGKNILVADSELLDRFTPDDIMLIKADAARLLAYRSKRVPPSTDTKVLTAWNGLALSGIAWFGMACDSLDAIELAARIANYYISTMIARGRVNRVAGKEMIHGFLEDHAALVNAFLDVHEATQDGRFLDAAKKIAGWALDQFHDGDGHFTESGTKNERLFSADNRVHDAVTPSGTSLVAWALFRLHAITADQRFIDVVDKVLKAHYTTMLHRPTSLALLVQALWAYLGHHHVITIPSNLATGEMVRSMRSMPIINRTIIVSPEKGDAISVCTGTSCQRVKDVAEIQAIIEAD
jgi:uncharacterized protein YyaL (SSP411 family)